MTDGMHVGGIVARAKPLRNAIDPEQSVAMQIHRRWTADDVRALTHEDRPWPRYELVRGELLVTPAPRGPHELVAFEFGVALHAYLDRCPIGFAMMSPADIELSPDAVTQPDAFVVPLGTTIADDMPEWSDITSLLLAIEVVSASSLRVDRIVKRDFYMAHNVSEYWIVDYDARRVERWTPALDAAELCTTHITWSPPGCEPLRIDLTALLGRIEDRWRRLRHASRR